jgi:Ca2+-binding EF-hand superfamily protein
MPTYQEILDDEAELSELVDEMFDRSDTDGSGQIDKSELKAVLTKLAQGNELPIPSDEDISRILRDADRDHSGTLSKVEFKIVVILILMALARDDEAEESAS